MRVEEGLDGTASPPGPPRVLVVDGDPAIRLICTTWLTLDGYEVLQAADGQEALELALAHVPAVVLLELSLPVLDGFGVAAALKADERTRELPLVVLSGETGTHVTGRVREIGAAGFFTKPFDPSAVSEFVRKVIADVTAGTPHPAGGHAF
jgi:DNA-binding response OmpR family regulator